MRLSDEQITRVVDFINDRTKWDFSRWDENVTDDEAYKACEYLNTYRVTFENAKDAVNEMAEESEFIESHSPIGMSFHQVNPNSLIEVANYLAPRIVVKSLGNKVIVPSGIFFRLELL